MPPKKAAATTKSTTKAKADKRKVVKEDSDVAANEDEVSGKKLDEKPSGRNRAPKEAEDKEVEAPPEKKKAAKEKPLGRNRAPKETEEKEVEAPPEKKKPAKAAASKKEKAENNKNEVAEKRPARSRKNEAVDTGEEKETQPTTKSKKAASKTKKATATKVKEAKKADSEEESDDEDSRETEEELSGPTKGRKRLADKKKSEKGEPEKKTIRSNATATDWENINFECSAKNSKGDTSNFHVTSWNVDGIRAWLKKGGLEILEHDQPDIFCIQETKCSLEKLPDELENIDGYETIWCSSDKEGYAGVGIVTKIKPLNVLYGIDSEEHDEEGRCITAEYEKFFVVNVYVPNAGRKLVTLPKRLEWNKLFKEHIKKLDERKPVIVCGDMNVAHTEIDLANPKTNTKNAGFTVEEREGMTDFLQDGYLDTFRQLYPDKEKAYTFWTYMANARAKNVGWRLDYFIVSERLMDNVCDNIIHSEALGSDHCPLSLHLNI